MLGTNVELGDVVTIITFCVVVFVVCVDGLVNVIFTGDMWGGKELAMLCIMLLILGLPLTGTVIVFETGTTAFGTSFRTTGEELEEFVRLRFLGFSSSSEQLTPSLLAVSAGTGRDALCWTAALATAFAVTVKAVWGTSLGISGTNLRLSMDHSEELLGPDILCAIVVNRSSFTALRTSARWRSVEMLRTFESSPRRSFFSLVRSPCARSALITPAYASNSNFRRIRLHSSLLRSKRVGHTTGIGASVW